MNQNLMKDIQLKKISYADLKNGNIDFTGDEYGIISEYFTEPVTKALLSNPNLIDDSTTALVVIYYKEKAVGRHMSMTTKVKVKDKIILANSGGSGEVNENVRGKRLGTTVTNDCVMNRDYPALYIGQMYSTGGLAMFRNMNADIFEYPLYYKLCKARTIIESKGIGGIPLTLAASFADVVLKVLDLPSRIKFLKLKQKYHIKKEKIIPQWVEDITLNDNREYMEIHDCKWLQWCLDNSFSDDNRDFQSFYAVYDNLNNPVGFFMTKERFEKKQGNYKNITRGTIVEWGSYDNKLSEADIILMANRTFSDRVDNIITILLDSSLDKEIKKMGFVRHGNYQVAIKCDEHNYLGIEDQSKWRIRWGGCNTIFM